MGHPEVKCPRCGWVHVSISLAEAQASVSSANEWDISQGRAPSMSLDRYRRCFRCSGPSQAFVLALEGDAPIGCTLQAVVIGDAHDRG